MTVEVEFSSVLATRVGTRRTYVAAPDGATLQDVIDRLADRYGPAVRSALVDDDRLRATATVRRRTSVAEESLSLRSHVSPGDRLRFEIDRSPAQAASTFNA